MKTIIADVFMTSALGNVKTNLKMSNINNIDNANYEGNINLQNFDIGKLLNRTDVGRITMNTDLEGKGFTIKYLKTNFSGKIEKVRYNNYDYTNVVVNGNFQKPIFSGKITVRDPNLVLDFEGSDIKNLAFFYSSFGAREEKYPGIFINRLPKILQLFKK